MTLPLIHIPVLQVLLAVGVFVSIAYCLLVLYSAREFFRPTVAGNGHASELPPVTILKPLRGLDAEQCANLSTFCRQEYDRFQIIFGVADPDDPAIGTVRRLQRDYPDLDIDLVIDGRVYGTNYKVSNLHNMYAHARHDVIVIADSDIRVGRDYLRRVVAPLRDPTVGLVSCLYKAVHASTLPAVIESLFINTDFSAMVMAARKVEKPSYAFGATMVLRRETLDAIGGFLAIRNYLADDYYLGHLIAARGLRLMLSDVVVETVSDVASWRRLLQHQIRWARTYRTVRPGGYFASILTHGTLWATLTMLADGCSRRSLAVAATVVGLRLWCAARLCFGYLHTDNTWPQLLLLPLKDLFVSAMWLVSFLGNHVQWSGHEFHVLRGGEMVRVTPPVSAWQQPPLVEPTRSAHDPVA